MSIQTRLDADGTAWVILDRADVHNAFDDTLIATLTAEFARVDRDPAARVMVLAAKGKSFSAGADLNWMARVARYSEAENLEDARRLAAMLSTLDRMSKPTVALVQGPAYGGGVGLVAACDMAIAAEEAAFALTEVKLGIIPAVISPYVVTAIGERASRRYMLTAERFDAREAYRLGLVHQVVTAAELDIAGRKILDLLLKNGPAALAACKDLIRAVARDPVDGAMIEDTAKRIASQRVSPEGREGIGAFLAKRPPNWIKG